jgi:hypothetical protein
MKKMKRVSAKKTTRKTKKDIDAMKLRYAITAVVVFCAILLGVLTAMGPKLSLQVPPIEAKAMDYIQKHNLLNAGEVLLGYKASSYYSYKSGVVITNKRVFAFYKDQVTSIPLNKITLVVVKDADFGHQEVLISAQANGVIGLEMYHHDAAKLIDMLNVPASRVKVFTKQGDEMRNDLPKGMKAGT